MSIKLAYSVFQPVNLIKNLYPHPILITHSMFGHRGNWTDFAQNLANKTKCQVYTLDARNHGESPRFPARGNFFDMAGDIIRFCDEHAINQSHLLGHSMGGLSSIVLALTQPSRVKSLAAIDISPISNPKSMIATNLVFTSGMENVMKNLHSKMSLKMARDFCETELEKLNIPSSMRRVLSSNIVKDSDKFICLTDLNTMERRFETDMFHYPKFDTSNVLPTIFIRAEKPTYLRLEHEGPILKLFPNASFIKIAGASHQVQLDCPNELMESYLKFFNSVENNNPSNL